MNLKIYELYHIDGVRAKVVSNTFQDAIHVLGWRDDNVTILGEREIEAVILERTRSQLANANNNVGMMINMGAT